MKKLMALVALGGLAVATMAMGMSTAGQIQESVDEAKLNAVIDARLHELLLKTQIEHPVIVATDVHER